MNWHSSWVTSVNMEHHVIWFTAEHAGRGRIGGCRGSGHRDVRRRHAIYNPCVGRQVHRPVKSQHAHHERPLLPILDHWASASGYLMLRPPSTSSSNSKPKVPLLTLPLVRCTDEALHKPLRGRHPRTSDERQNHGIPATRLQVRRYFLLRAAQDGQFAAFRSLDPTAVIVGRPLESGFSILPGFFPHCGAK